ncbi:MAG: glycosyltransferase family 2 protein [Aurantimicrobium sp.]
MGKNKAAVSVVVPAYNESASIQESLARIDKVLAGTGRDYEIIVVSDGSTDNTSALVTSVGVNSVRLVENDYNKGKGFTLRHGFSEAKNPLVVFIDGDLDLNPSVLPDYLDRLDADEADVIIGSKMHPQSQIDYPLSRRIASRIFKMATRVVTGLKISDTQTGLKAMNRNAVAPSIERCDSDGFSFDLEFLAQVTDSGGRIKDAPVILDFDFTSTIGTSSALKALFDLRYASRYRRWKNRKALGR